MQLIRDVVSQPIDPSYEVAARGRDAKARRRALRSPLMAVTAVLIGFLLATAALTLRVPANERAQVRADLAERVEQAGQDAQEDREAIQQLQGEIQTLQEQKVGGAQGQSGVNRLRQAAVSAAAVESEGPGVRVVLDDASPDGTGQDSVDPRAQEQPDAPRVQARDISLVVNALWEQGAEAIAVNGERIASTSAIRFAGQATLVNFHPLTRPYEIVAIGPEDLGTRLQNGPYGQELSDLREFVGLKVEVHPESSLTVPAAPQTSLRAAKPQVDDARGASPSTEPSGTTGSSPGPSAESPKEDP